ncbi:MAG: hypothetical protein HKN47_25405 [Pirellulaceae bacterium]|nr:hypothetical protein [Pirellulaceae bacterium]
MVESIVKSTLMACLLGTPLFAITLAISAIGPPTASAATPTTASKLLADVSGTAVTKSKSRDASDRIAATTVDADQERAATELVQTHLPELTKLLDRLKQDDQRQYNLAIRDLAKSARRLDMAKNRDQEFYEIEVELLKTQSSIKLLTAKLKVRDNQADRESLRQAAQRFQDAELAKARYNIRMLKERVERTEQLLATANKRLASIEDDRQSHLEKKYTGFLRSAGRHSNADPKPKSKKKN